MENLNIDQVRTYETIRSLVEDNSLKFKYEVSIQDLQEDPDVKDLKIHKIDYLVYKEKLIEIMFVSYIYEMD